MHELPHRGARAPWFVSPLALCASLLGQAPPGYYASVNTSSPTLLRQTLHAAIKDHRRYPYTSSATDTWNILEQADEHPGNGNAILDLYKNSTYTKVGGGTSSYDREHSWPKSYGFPNDGASNYPYTDCHHLFLCDSSYNSSRSNKPYRVADAAASEKVTVFNNGAGGGSGVYPGNSNWTDGSFTLGRWETWGDRRGDVARALMYLDVRYEGGTHGITGYAEPDLRLTDDVNLIQASNAGSNLSVAYMGLLSVLRQWHAEDPVDAKEMARNDVVFAYQGNRNPFIDHPEWVECLFGGACGDATPPNAPTGLVAVGGNANVALDWASNTDADLAGYHVFRGTTSGGPYAQISSTLLSVSAYTDTAVSNGTTYYYVVKAQDVSGNLSSASAQASARPQAPQPSTAAWINEFHYDNAGTDTGEFVEVAGVAGTDLSGWKLLAYNGSNGQVYTTVNLSGTLANQSNGFGTRAFSVVLQNGAPDGIALVSPTGTVLQFLSYEGTFTATNGAATGRTSTAIATSETASTPVGYSLQLQGNGNGPEDFSWSSPIPATKGSRNTGQTFSN
ncbi:MAG: endonuclease [Planctomycetota bacterium]